MKWPLPVPVPLPAVVPLSAPQDRLGVLPGGLAGVHDAVLRTHTALLVGAVRLHTDWLLPAVACGGIAASMARLLLAFAPECVRARPLRRAAAAALALHAAWPYLRDAAPLLALALLLMGGAQGSRHGRRALQLAACMCLAAPAAWWRVAVVEIPRSARFEPCLAGLVAWAACRRSAPAARVPVATAIVMLAAAAGLWASLRWAFAALGLLLCPAIYRGGGGGVASRLLALAPCAALALALPFPPFPPLPMLPTWLPLLPPLHARVLVSAVLCGLLACAAPEQRVWWRRRAALARPTLSTLALAVSVCCLRPWCCALGAETTALRRRPSVIGGGAREFWLGATTAGPEAGLGVRLDDKLPWHAVAWADLAPALWTDAAVRAVRRAAVSAGCAIMSLRQQQQQRPASVPLPAPLLLRAVEPEPAKPPFFCDDDDEEYQLSSRRPHAAGPWQHASLSRGERLSDCIAAATAAATAARAREYGSLFPPLAHLYPNTLPPAPSPLLSASAFGSNSGFGSCSNCGFRLLLQQQQQQQQQSQQKQKQQQAQKRQQWQQHGRQEAASPRELTPGWVVRDWAFLSQQAVAAGRPPPIDYRAGRGRSILVARGEEQPGFSFLHRSNIATGTITTLPIPTGSSTSVSMEAEMGTGIGVEMSGGKAARRKPWRRGDPFPGPLHGSHDLAPAPLHHDAEAEDATEPGGGTLVLLLALGAVQSVVQWWWAGCCALVAAGLGLDVQIGGGGSGVPEGLQGMQTRGNGGCVPPSWELQFA